MASVRGVIWQVSEVVRGLGRAASLSNVYGALPGRGVLLVCFPGVVTLSLPKSLYLRLCVWPLPALAGCHLCKALASKPAEAGVIVKPGA
jgi:hypothetical protein